MKWLITLLISFPSIAQTVDTMHLDTNNTYTYLALGDSYTIGEGVSLTQSFPYQTVALLRKEGYRFTAPEIVAKTGWTTDELEEGVSGYTLLEKYDFVSLLIGVNNQYRGRDIIEYKEQFERLLKRSIEIAGGKRDRVIVLSIPDYGATPYGREHNSEKISKEIDQFNTLNHALAVQYKVQYLDISNGPGDSKSNPALVGDDGLHPAANEYTKWAEKLAETILSTAGKKKPAP
jgi:lysophospholipase L1-like esterase